MMGRLAARNNVEVTKVDRIVENLILTNVYAVDTNFRKETAGCWRWLGTRSRHRMCCCLLFCCYGFVMVLLWFCCQRRTRDDPRNPMDLCMLRLTGRIRRIQRWTGRYESPLRTWSSRREIEGERGEDRRTVVVMEGRSRREGTERVPWRGKTFRTGCFKRFPL